MRLFRDAPVTPSVVSGQSARDLVLRGRARVPGEIGESPTMKLALFGEGVTGDGRAQSVNDRHR